MAKNNSTAAPDISKMHAAIQPTGLQQLVEEMRMNQLHLSNLLRLAKIKAEDEMETIVAAGLRYLDDDYRIWEKIRDIAREEAGKEGTQL